MTVIVFGPFFLNAVAEDSASSDKMAVRRLASEHTRTFGKDKLVRPKKDNTNILIVDIDPTEYTNWVNALNDSLKNASSDEKKSAIAIQRANAQLKTYLDSLNELDKRVEDATGKVEKALQNVTNAQQELAKLVITKKSALYSAYEFVFTTYEKVKKELEILVKTMGNAQFIPYDQNANLISKPFYASFYENEITTIKKLLNESFLGKLLLKNVKDVLLGAIKSLQQTRTGLQKAFKEWYQNGLIIVPSLTGDQKKAYIALVNKFNMDVKDAQKKLQNLEQDTKQYPDLDAKRQDYLNKFEMLESNGNDLKIALATA
jgi:hypothetical protein